MYTAVPTIGPSIVPSPPMMVTNAISAVHWTLNTAAGCTWSWLIASSAPTAPQPAPATTNTSILAGPTRAAAGSGPLLARGRCWHGAAAGTGPLLAGALHDEITHDLEGAAGRHIG